MPAARNAFASPEYGASRSTSAGGSGEPDSSGPLWKVFSEVSGMIPGMMG
ncbi:hypothetical protein GCM10009613_10320 [Pseudonocardia kongjuensis]|uniref:Uncharacterized protein n=1 Tax=Pseudonocardia kongjuensis TaxID=102227 RepID=A0ABN1XIB3_9PSEU